MTAARNPPRARLASQILAAPRLGVNCALGVLDLRRKGRCGAARETLEREAVEQGAIAQDRWESYGALLAELESAPRDWE